MIKELTLRDSLVVFGGTMCPPSNKGDNWWMAATYAEPVLDMITCYYNANETNKIDMGIGGPSPFPGAWYKNCIVCSLICTAGVYSCTFTLKSGS